MNQRGLDQDGLIMREGSLSRVPATFAPVVDAARRQIAAAFDERRLHSAYLYGSIPRGTAIPGVSDLDLMLALHHEPAHADRADADVIEAALDLAFAQIDGVGVGLCRASTLLSELERYDLALARWRARAAQAASGAERKSLSRTAARRIVRTGFTLVMPRWHGWTSDLATSAGSSAITMPAEPGRCAPPPRRPARRRPIPPCCAC